MPCSTPIRCRTIFALALAPAAAFSAPTVSNVAFLQQPDGAGGTRVVVSYDLASLAPPSTVSLCYSLDGGATFSGLPAAVSGDVGPGIASGAARSIAWDIAADLPAQAQGSFAVQVLATDATSSVGIANHSFETDAQANGFLTVTTPTGWQVFNPANINGTSNVVGTLNPTGTGHFASVPDGGNCALVFMGGPPVGEAGLRQLLSETVAANTRYTLTAEVGNIDEGTANFGYFDLRGFPGYRIELTAGLSTLAADNNTLAPPDGQWATSQIAADIAGSHPEIGSQIAVVLVNLDIPGTPSAPAIEVNFDNIRVVATGLRASAAGTMETVAPSPGTLAVPPAASSSPIPIPFSGASDASGIASVALWFRTDATAWAPTGETIAGSSGTFSFVPPGAVPANHGNYHFEVVAEDALGNRSAAPSGMAGTGQGTTSFDTSARITDWQVM